MQLKKLVDTINRTYISSDYLRQPDIYYFMDRVIDDINERLQACYPTFSEWEDYVEEYNKQFEDLDSTKPEPIPDHPGHLTHPNGKCGKYPRPALPTAKPKDRTVYDVIPDKYLRSVVALGTALYFYENDEEGEQIALDYQNRYNQQLFYMVRDYHLLVPIEFQNNTGGYIDFSYEREHGPRNLHPRGVVMHGSNTRVL